MTPANTVIHRRTLRKHEPGVFLLTAILFVVGKTLLGIYLGMSTTASSYGAAGSLVVLVVWVYYSAQIFYFGAEFTHVHSLHNRDKLHEPRNPKLDQKAA